MVAGPRYQEAVRSLETLETVLRHQNPDSDEGARWATVVAIYKRSTGRTLPRWQPARNHDQDPDGGLLF